MKGKACFPCRGALTLGRCCGGSAWLAGRSQLSEELRVDLALDGAAIKLQEVLTYLYGRQSNWTILLYSESRQSADILTVYLDRNGIVSNYAFSKEVTVPERYFPTRPLSVGLGP